MPHIYETKRAKHLDSFIRRLLFPPKKFLTTMGLKPDDILLDIGAGTGYFTIPASQILTYGKVIAIDTQDEMLQLLSHKIKKQNINNIEIIHSNDNNPSVPEDLGTVAFMSFVLHEVEDKKEMLVNVHRALKKGGKIVIVECSKYAIFGPPKQERISAEYVKKLLEETGFIGITVKKLTMFTYMAKAFKH